MMYLNNNSAFHYFKMQEISQFNYDLKTNTYGQLFQGEADWNDYVDFKLRMEDHGDDKVTVQVFLNEKCIDFIESKQFLPDFNPSQIIIAGGGISCFLRSVRISQRERQTMIKIE